MVLTHFKKSAARLVSQWMAVGFIHGVMNTDNIALSGETLDYGPCAFMDEYRSDKTFSSIDRKGRYAYDKQADIMKWNLGILLECLALLANGPAEIEQLKNIWQNFKEDYESHFSEAFAKKLGFLSASKEDSKIVQKWLSYLESKSLDFTGSFSALSQLAVGKARQLPLPETPEFNDFYALWRARIDQQDPHQTLATLQSANPYYIPRNHIIEEVITKANEGDFRLFYDMLRVVKKPFEVQDNMDRFAFAPSIEERVQKTFCGT